MIDLTSTAGVRHILQKFALRPTKSLGQNFFVSAYYLNRILDALDIDRDTGVLEIGSGLGTLTAGLAGRAGSVAAVEIDRKLIPVLEHTLAECENVEIINADVLSLDLREICASLNRPKLKIVSNLPYYITTPVIERLLVSRCFDDIAVLVQREACDRLTAPPGSVNYCAASVLVAYYATASRLFAVPRSCFYPQPGVDSALLRLTPRSGADARFDADFLKLVDAAFAQRRKTLANALSGRVAPRERVAAALSQCGYAENIRGEALGYADFTALAKLLF